MGGTPSKDLTETDLAQPQLFESGKAIRVVVVSDTHDRLLTEEHAKLIPQGDVFIHCGDITEDGTADEILAFNQWLGLLKHPIKVVIAGNHDLHAHPESYQTNVANCNRHRKERHQDSKLEEEALSEFAAAESAVDGFKQWRRNLKEVLLSNATHYLEGESLTVDIPGKRSIRIVGAPHTDIISVSAMRAFALSEADQKAAFDAAWPEKLPQLDVLVTHGPPRHVRDSFLGMASGSLPLANKIARMHTLGKAPKFHVFGHVHKQRGAQQGATLMAADGASVDVPTTFINAAAVAGRQLTLRIPPAIYFDVMV